MKRRCTVLAVILSLLASQKLSAADITLDGSKLGRTFEGIGAVSAGASSRLLVDYPNPQRSEILDYLFKPNFGAALQHFKVEIGGDVNSTDGCEPSHQHTRYDTNFNRGYEWWLMKEAKARNPNVILDSLAWGAPGWIGNGNYWSQDMADYVVNFLKGAKEIHGLDIQFTGVRNEVFNNTNWIITLRHTLDAAGLANVKIVAGDEWGGTWKIVDDVRANPAVSNAIYAIGAHYPSHLGYTSPPGAMSFSQPLWASEEGIGGATWAKALSLAKVYNRNYIVGKMTKSEIWSPITSYYDLLPAAGSGLMRANSPWSGNYTVSPAIWATAHTTQFASPGWKYLDDTGCGVLVGGGSYVTLKSTNNSDFSIVIETADASAIQNVTFHLTNGLAAGPIRVWRTSASQQFVELGSVPIVNGALAVSFDPGCIYTLTTTSGQAKGAASIPAAKPFPLPYMEDFESCPDGSTPRYLSDQSGIFEVVERGDGRGHCLRQVTTSAGIPWAAQISPYTILGDSNWRDYEVSAEVLLETNGSAYLYGRIADIPGFSDPVPRAYWLVANSSRTWELHSFTNTLASGSIAFPTNVWHRMKLAFAGNNIKAFINGVIVADVNDTAFNSGLVGIGCGRHGARFDNLFIAPRHRSAMNLAPSATATASSYWQNDSAYAASRASDGDETTRWNAAGSDLAGAWLQLDFGGPRYFNHTHLSQFGDRITAFKIQAWTGSVWQDLVISSSNLGLAREDFFSPMTASKVRLLITAATNVPSIYEFAVSFEPVETNLALAANASASSVWNNDSNYTASQANDGSASTRWNASASDQVNCWLQLNFGAPRTFNKTSLRQFGDRITGYQIQYWSGNAWAIAFTGGQLGESRTDVFPAVTSDKARLYVTDATNVPSICEFQVFLDSTLAKSVVINEWMIRNTVVSDPKDGKFQSWFELYNPGNLAMDLTGWYLSGNPLNPFQFQVPSGFILPARGFLLAWADAEPTQNVPFTGDLHVSFRLEDSAIISLCTPVGEPMDAIDLLPNVSGVSYGSRADGMEPILPTVVPTPRSSNTRLLALNITEVLNGKSITFAGVPEQAHRIEAASDLFGTWSDICQVVARADGWFEYVDTNPPSARRFYRTAFP